MNKELMDNRSRRNTANTTNTVGILTLCRAENYGAVLQSYALCNYMNAINIQTQIIDFIPAFIIGRYKILNISASSIKSFVGSIIFGMLEVPQKLSKRLKFNRFRYKSGFYSKTRIKKQIVVDFFDAYIVGSDQVWNLELTRYDENFFLPFCDSKKKYSYAASLGNYELSDEQKKLFCKWLPTFASVSVRETTGRELLISNGIIPNSSISSNIDPVFLMSRREWEIKAKKYKSIKQGYILIYAFEAQTEATEIYKKFYLGKPIVRLTYDKSRVKKNAEREICNAGPEEFLWLIKEADAIITDSFHGIAFSIIFEKEFWALKYKGTSLRMTDLLNMLGLNDRLYNGTSANSSIDYSHTKRIIEDEQMRAYKYLCSIGEQL